MLNLLLSATCCLLVVQKGFSFIQSSPLHSRQRQHTTCSMSLFDRIRSAIIRQQPDGDIDRVVKCWDKFSTGVGVERYLDAPTNKVLQTADCFVEGLAAMPFHPIESIPWALKLEDHASEILKELNDYNTQQKAIQRQTLSAESEWLPPRDTAGSAYGPEWKTLGLQDRSVWDDNRVLEFPRTVKLLKQFNVPSCEVFFAKQGPKSGIKPHSDKNNFIITCHLALDVPEGECWIQVGDTKYNWKNGKAVVFDTSIMHSTENSSERDRYVLLIRFWHPELTMPEQKAFKFIFDMLDHAALGEQAMDQFEFESMQGVSSFMGKDQHKGLGATVGDSGRESKKMSGKEIKESKKKSDRESDKESKKASANRSGGGGFGAPK